MPIIYENNEKKRKNNKINGFLTIFVLIIALALCISTASLLSGFITTSALSFSSNKDSQLSHTVYAISLFSHTNITNVEAKVSDYQIKGAAGYVYFTGTTYHILASCYNEKSDAEKVKDTLSSSGQSCEILTITFPEIVINSKINSEQKSIITNCLSVFKNTYLSLYDASVALDTKTESEAEIYSRIGAVLTSIEQTRQKFNSTFSSVLTEELLKSRLKIAEAKSIVEELNNKKNQTTNLSSDIKNSYFKILFLQDDLCDELKNEF